MLFNVDFLTQEMDLPIVNRLPGSPGLVNRPGRANCIDNNFMFTIYDGLVEEFLVQLGRFSRLYIQGSIYEPVIPVIDLLVGFVKGVIKEGASHVFV